MLRNKTHINAVPSQKAPRNSATIKVKKRTENTNMKFGLKLAQNFQQIPIECYSVLSQIIGSLSITYIIEFHQGP